MSCLYRIIFIFCMAAALIGLPLPSMAAPSQVITTATNTFTPQLSASNLFQKGVDEILGGNYKEAIAALTQAIHLNPKDAKAYSNRGLVRAALRDLSGAMQDFNRALRLNPELATVYYNRGFVRSQMEDYQGAIADLSQAIRLNPQDADAYQCRCRVRYTVGDRQGMMEDLHKAVDIYRQKGELEQYQALVNNIKKLLEPIIFSMT